MLRRYELDDVAAECKGTESGYAAEPEQSRLEPRRLHGSGARLGEIAVSDRTTLRGLTQFQR